jgi:SAM-dependent methyltransferase
MELPDVGGFSAVPAAVVRDLSARLRAIGLDAPLLGRLARVGERLDDPLRRPMRVWNARRLREPAAVAVRLFILHDPVDPGEARAALGDLSPVRDLGLVEEISGALVSSFHLAIAAGMYVFGDRPGAHPYAVMPLCGATLDLARAAMPARPVARALDLGCGAGAVGLLLARVARGVVATDISARALAFARLNATLNSVEHLETRQGDLFEAVAGERFECIAAQPPFHAQRPTSPRSIFMHGGPRGDELCLRALSRAPDHLAPGGRATVLADWPLMANDNLEDRMRSMVGPRPFDVLVIQSPAKNLDEYCALHAGIEHDDLGEAFSRAAIAQRDHLEHWGLLGLSLAFGVVEPVADGAQGTEFTSSISVRHPSDAPVTSEAIDRFIAARRLVFRGGGTLAAACLRFPGGARLVAQPLPDGEAPAVIVQFPAGRPEWPSVLDASSAVVVERIARAATVADAARDIAHRAGVAFEESWPGVERVARDALLRGALEVWQAGESSIGRG